MQTANMLLSEGIYLHTLAVNQLCGMWWLSYDHAALPSSKATFIIAEGRWTLYGATVHATVHSSALYVSNDP